MAQFERYFTVEEARAELPWLQDELSHLQAEIQRLEESLTGAGPAITQAPGNGGGPAASHHVDRQLVVADIIGSITDRGIQIKDPVRGLVDFPHLRDGAEVLLCWLLGEDDIRYWHDLESGFRGRMPL